MTGWDEVVSTALVGTERRPFGAEQLNDVVGDAVVDVQGAEAAVLAAAAVLTTYRRAGRVPDPRPVEVTQRAPGDDRPLCSEAALQLLSLLLDGMVKVAGGNEPIVAEWLSACARTGRRPPEDTVVRLLETGTVQPGLRGAIAAVAGPRGAWLATLNPDWSWAGSTPSAHEFTEDDLARRYAAGSRAERVALLSTLRARDPEAGRALLLSTWSTEPAAERAALITTLATGLGPDDEPFLEDALDDRGATVRATAATLLERLPESRWAARTAERARPLVRGGGRFRRKLVVELPDSVDAADRRDGITDQHEQGTGLKAAWLTQIVAATPLRIWEDHLGVDPAGAVALAVDEPEVLSGWEQAAMRQGDGRWASVLLTLRWSPGLVGVLEPAAAVAYLSRAVGRRTVPDAEVVESIAAVPGPWPVDCSRRVIERVRTLPGPLAGMTLPYLSTRLDPSVLPAVEEWIGAIPEDRLRRDVRGLAHALSIRQTIHREFS